MKRIKPEGLLLLAAAVFLVFCTGFFLGGRTASGGLRVITEKTSVPQERELAANTTDAADTHALPAPEERLDLNTATAEDLIFLPGIGPTLAQRIVDYREKNGPFTAVDELKNVSGIGEKRLEALRDYVTVEEAP